MNANSELTPATMGRIGATFSYWFGLNVALFVVAVGAYKTIGITEPSTSWQLITLASATVVAFLSWRLAMIAKSERRAFAISSTGNILLLILSFGILEAGLRILADESELGHKVGPVYVKGSWSAIRESLAKSAREANDEQQVGKYIVADPDLGWTIAPYRTAKGGMFASSRLGIRSPSIDVDPLSDRPPRMVAIVGDSNAFSDEVSYEDSWGHHLDKMLGSDTAVHNFGVGGYGVDQAVLRFERDVSPLRPDVVLLGFIEGDFIRSASVYPAISLGWALPFGKPRFLHDQGRLALHRDGILNAGEFLGTSDVFDLPLLQYSANFDPVEWRIRGNSASMTIRFLASVFRRWPDPDPRWSPKTVYQLNLALVNRFVASAQAIGAEPVLVYFPAWISGDFAPRGHNPDSAARRLMRESGATFVDLTPCIRELPDNERWVESRHHLNSRGNEVAAECVLGTVRGKLRFNLDMAEN